MSEKTVSYACQMSSSLSELNGLTIEHLTVTPEIAGAHQPIIIEAIAIKPKDGEVYSKPSSVIGLRYLERAGRLVLQYGREAVVFIDGKFDRNEVIWQDVPIITEDKALI